MCGGVIKTASTKFQSIKHEFCIVFDRNTEINEIADDKSINIDSSFDFTSINKIAEMNP